MSDFEAVEGESVYDIVQNFADTTYLCAHCESSAKPAPQPVVEVTERAPELTMLLRRHLKDDGELSEEDKAKLVDDLVKAITSIR